MKLPITIKFNTGDEATYIVNPPDCAKWEIKTGKTIRQNDSIGMNDLMFLAYTAMVRSTNAKQVKPYETWILGIEDIEVGEADPKATQSEA